MVMSGLVNKVDVSHFRLSLHLTTAFIILTLILWQIFNLKIKLNSNYGYIKFKLPEIFIFLIFLQIIVGAFVSGMDAGKIYNSWPLMGSTFFPNDNNLYNLFKISAFSEPSLVQFMHRNLAYIIMSVYLITLYLVISNKLIKFNKTVIALGLILFLQIVLGILTVTSGAQMFIASMHQISSILLVSFSVYFLFINTKKN
jgi:cytochrome c oxidase assembly protein subunit 15